jgi:hypothetical protein
MTVGRSQRAKGKAGERAAKLLFQERDWEVHGRPRGEAGDDFTAIDPKGKVWSVEVKNTKSVMFNMLCQAKRNCPKNRGFILCWHPSQWGMPANLWVLFIYPRGERPYVRAWYCNEPAEKDALRPDAA